MPWSRCGPGDEQVASAGRGAAALLLLALILPPTDGACAGVVVESVAADATSGEVALEAGDRVLGWRQGTGADAVRGQISDPFEWRWLEVERAPRGPVTLEIERDGARAEVVLQPGTRGPGLWRLTVRPQMDHRLERGYRNGLAALGQGSPTTAVAAWDALRRRRAVRRDPVLEAWLLVRGARVRLDEGDGEAADARFAEAAAIADRAGCDLARAAVRDEWGRALYRSGEYQRALEVHRGGLAVRDAGDLETLWHAAGVHDVGTMTLVLGDLDGAAELLEDAAAVRARLAPDSLAEAESVNNLGLALVYAGRFEQAQARLTRSLAIREMRVPGSLDVAAGYNNLGLVAKERGDFDAAERFYLRDLELSQRLDPGSDGVAVTLMNLGGVAWERGDLELAERRFRDSLAILDRLERDGINVAANLNNLALVAEQRGELATAEVNLRRALEIWRGSTPDSQEVAEALLNLGLIAWRRKDLDSAEDLLGQARAMLDRIAPENQSSAMVQLMLGDVELERGNLERAEELYRGSLELRERIMPGSPEIASNLINLAEIAEQRGDLDGAETLLERALSLRETVSPDSLWVAASLHALGGVALARGDLEAAEARLVRALEIRARLAPGSTEQAETLYRLGQASRRGGRLEEAAERLERAIAALEQQTGRLGGGEEARAGFRAHFAQLFRELLEVQLELGRPAEAFETLERSRAQLFLATLTERDLVFSADLPEELERRRKRVAWDYDRTLEQLRELDPQLDADRVEAAVSRLAELRRERVAVGEAVRAAAPRLAALQYPAPLDARGALEALDPGVLVLAYSVGETSSTLFTLSRSRGLAVHRLEVGRDQLRDLVSALRAAIVTGGTEGFAALQHLGVGRRLYDLLVRPAEAAIEDSVRLVILPDGPLHALPFGALVTSPEDEAPHYLLERRPLAVTLSVTVLDELARGRPAAASDPGQWRVVGFGDPDYGGGASPSAEREAVLRSISGRGATLDPLPATRNEVGALTGLWQEHATTFLGGDATEGRALAVSDAATVLHFACHGLLDEDFPLDSALALAAPQAGSDDGGNGLLQAWEIFEKLRLQARVVTLSACQTGLGRELGGEGLVGLSRAFQYAGARSVVASLWSVSDLSTARLMTNFYRALRAGRSISDSLREAQLQILRGDPGEGGDAPAEWRHPFFWAAFQVVGDWR